METLKCNKKGTNTFFTSLSPSRYRHKYSYTSAGMKWLWNTCSMNPEKATNVKTLLSSSPAECCSGLHGTSVVGGAASWDVRRHFDSVTDWPGLTVAGTAYWWSELTSHEQPCVAAVRVSRVALETVSGLDFLTEAERLPPKVWLCWRPVRPRSMLCNARRLQKNLRHLSIQFKTLLIHESKL